MATAPKISNLPVAPNRQQPANFAAKGDALLSSLQGFATEANALGDYVEDAAGQVAIDKAAVDANVPLLTDAKAAAPLALSYRDTAKGYRDAAAASEVKALQYKNDLASAVVYQNLASIALSKNITMVDGCIDTSPNPSLAVQRRTSWFAELGPMPVRKVTIAEAYKVTIFNGDDPSLPEWVSFSVGSSTIKRMIGQVNGEPVTCVDFEHGVLAVGTAETISFASGAYYIDFARDARTLYKMGGYAGPYLRENIAERNTAGYGPDNGRGVDLSGSTLLNGHILDILLTVPKGAPVDAHSGLPKPVLCIGNAEGTDVVRYDGSIAHFNHTSFFGLRANHMRVDGEDLHVLTGGSSSQYAERVIPHFATSESVGITGPAWPKQNARFTHAAIIDGEGTHHYGAARNQAGADDRLRSVHYNKQDLEKSMQVDRTSKFNTGWMVGDIRVAWLSSKEVGVLVGSDFITNGKFDGNLNDWDIPSDGWSYSGGRAYHAPSSTYRELGQTLDISDPCIIEADLEVISGNLQFFYTISGGTGKTQTFAVGTHRLIMHAPNGVTRLAFARNTASSGEFYVDNVSVRRADHDRSVNNKGLAIHGSPTRTPVVTGAELVGCGGFSASDYLEQPYNADLDFGTGDFCVMGWVNPSGLNTRYILDRRTVGAASSGFQLFLTTGNFLKFETSENTAGSSIVSPVALPSSDWSFIAARISDNGTIASLYINGVIAISSVITARNVNNSVAKLILGIRSDLAGPWVGSLALLRIGASAPNPEQIAKIYRDERPMFQPNSKVTLHGTSDAVTALAHDETTGLIHAGTSAGRSDFSGLVRVDQTDTPITTKIVAHDGMILEQ